MNSHNPRVLAAACAVAALSLSGIAAGADRANATATNDHPVSNATNAMTHATTDRKDRRDEARGAAEDVAQAVGVVHRMEQADPALAKQLQRASGVFIVPKYGRAALGVGGRGGVGLLLVHNGDRWSDPAFYNFGGISAGLQAGAEGGSFVLLLNNQKAVDSFMQDNNWSLNAGAGLTIVNWSKKALGSGGMGDVTVWSDTKGLFGGAAISLTDVNYDEDQSAAYYGKPLSARDIVAGNTHSTKADRLQQALADPATSAAGKSGSRDAMSQTTPAAADTSRNTAANMSRTSPMNSGASPATASPAK
jgi:SH3 domain-containing YSC84-like protein 1